MQARIIGLVAAFTATIFFLTGPSAQEKPDGPSSLSETYEDWTVGCTAQGEGRRCVFSQRQARQDGQRILGIELAPLKDGGLRGVLVLPFGLALDRGVTFGIDDTPPGKPSAFKTCLPVGCVVPLTFTAGTARALRTGTALKVGAIASNKGKEVAFSVSLKGFSAVVDRTATLARRPQQGNR